MGTVVAWPMASNPSDADSWLECNGQSTAGYPELAAVVGAAVPNYQGLFLRGRGGNSAGLGVRQGDAGRSMAGTLSNVLFWNWGSAKPGASGAFKITSFSGIANMARGSSEYGPGEISLNTDIPTANENRPVNMAVRYLIRARP